MPLAIDEDEAPELADAIFAELHPERGPGDGECPICGWVPGGGR